jgi:hypothetical protein
MSLTNLVVSLTKKEMDKKKQIHYVNTLRQYLHRCVYEQCCLGPIRSHGHGPPSRFQPLKHIWVLSHDCIDGDDCSQDGSAFLKRTRGRVWFLIPRFRFLLRPNRPTASSFVGQGRRLAHFGKQCEGHA